MTIPRRLVNARIVQPLRARDFALLVGGSVVSLLGDGFFYVALTWQVYSISNVPTALSFVGVAWMLPSVLLLLVGGTFSDRYDRRRLMVGADLLRAAALGAMTALAFAGVLELWHIALLVAFLGVGDAFFNPASTAIIPDLVPDEHLPAANALAGMYRPLMLRMIGPAIAGVVVAVAGTAPAFGVDAASFAISALVIATIRTRPTARPAASLSVRQTLTELGEGLSYARGQAWIWATLLAAMLGLFVFIGPVEVLVPFLIKNRLDLGPDALGAIFAMGGLGSISMSVLIGTLGMPRRQVTVMYVAWSAGTLVVAGYGLMTSLWQALLISFVLQAFFQLGSVIWTTMLQQRVPRDLLGRVSSLDWMVSTGLVPVSFALTGPVSDVLGPETTVVAAGLLAALVMFALLFVPGVRDPEQTPTALPHGVAP